MHNRSLTTAAHVSEELLQSLEVIIAAHEVLAEDLEGPHRAMLERAEEAAGRLTRQLSLLEEVL